MQPERNREAIFCITVKWNSKTIAMWQVLNQNWSRSESSEISIPGHTTLNAPDLAWSQKKVVRPLQDDQTAHLKGGLYYGGEFRGKSVISIFQNMANYKELLTTRRINK